MSLRIYLSPDGRLLLDAEQVVDQARPGTTTGPTGAAVAKRAGVKLVPDVRGVPRLNPADVPKLLATRERFDAEEADKRSRWERYLDTRRERRVAKARELARIERENEKAEQLAIQRGLHQAFLADKAAAEERARRTAASDPDAPALDPDLTTWLEQGAPEEPPPAPPVPQPVPVPDDEGDIVDG